MKFIFGKKLVDQNEVAIGYNDLALLRGYGLFDFFRYVNFQPLFIDDHLERLYRSADRLRLRCPIGRRQLKMLIHRMIRENGMKDGAVRMILTGGYTENAWSISRPNFYATNEPVRFPDAHHYEKGIKLLSESYLRDVPDVKTINYLMGIYRQPELDAAGAFDLLFHQDERISELTRSNFYIVDEGGTIKTPVRDILQGVTRKHLLKFASEHYPVMETDITLNDLKTVKEAFITGTTKKVLAVRQVDDRVIGEGQPGPVTLDLMKRFELYCKAWTDKEDSFN